MQKRNVDIAIIGAGTAGLNAVAVARKSGKSWILIDPGPYGTTCARVGCMPSKLLIAAADVAHSARYAGKLGVSVSGVNVDSTQVMARLRRERDRFVRFVVEDTEALPSENRLLGTARFIDANTLEVTTRDEELQVQAGAVVIATGSSALVPSVFDEVRDRVITNDNLFQLDELPRSVAVIGTGIVGLELGQALSRLGVEVTFLDRSEHPGPCTDPEVLRCIEEVMGDELRFHMNAEITSALRHNEQVKIDWKQQDGSEHAGLFDAVLAAAGRPPNLESLNLAVTGLELDDRGMPGWNPYTTQCGDKPIFLAGDANAHLPLLHEAGDEGRISGENAAQWPEVTAHSRRAALAVVFCDPQIAMVGATYDSLDADASCIGEASFDDQGRARVMAVNRGLMRVYARRSDCTLIGAEMFGPRMEHMAHLLAWAVQQEISVQRLLEMPIYHPTFEEGMRSALRDLARKLRVESECRSEDMAESPGM
jgi:dihydrolipoamide dehydrogenase